MAVGDPQGAGFQVVSRRVQSRRARLSLETCGLPAVGVLSQWGQELQGVGDGWEAAPQVCARGALMSAWRVRGSGRHRGVL